MSSNIFEIINELIGNCNDFFDNLKLGDNYNLNYYTIFTKSEEEKEALLAGCRKYMKLIDSSNGVTFQNDGLRKLPSQVKFLRIRNPDDSKTVVAGDVLGANLEEVIQALDAKGINSELMERKDNTIVAIMSSDARVAIYFPKTHFLEKFLN